MGAAIRAQSIVLLGNCRLLRRNALVVKRRQSQRAQRPEVVAAICPCMGVPEKDMAPRSSAWDEIFFWTLNTLSPQKNATMVFVQVKLA